MIRHAILADTGPIYAAADPSDRYHKQAHEELVYLGKQGQHVVLLYPTLMEAYTLVMRHLGIKLAHRWLVSFTQGAGLLNPTLDDYRAAGQRVRKYADQEITLFDALVAIVSDRLRIPVWTYDSDFDLMDAEVWRDK